MLKKDSLSKRNIQKFLENNQLQARIQSFKGGVNQAAAAAPTVQYH